MSGLGLASSLRHPLSQRRPVGGLRTTGARSVVVIVPLRPCSPAQRAVLAHGLGSDALDGWLDVTKLVSGGGSSKSPYEEFASAIGRDIYVDIAGWHLYLRDMGAGVPGSTAKMSQALAQQLGPQLNRGLREADVEGMLRKIPVKLGAGKLKASLHDVMPAMCVGDLVRLCEEYARR